MNHEEHFSEEQIAVITSIFEQKINSLLIKTVGTYFITLLLAVLAVGGAWQRLGQVETGLANVQTAVNIALPSKEYVDKADADLQRQLEGTTQRLDRIEDKLDVIIDRL